MTLRLDHIAGLAFIGFGILVFALSGELPTGQLSMPGSGFLPKIVAGLSIFFGLILALRAGEGPPFASINWEDGPHALKVTVITAVAIALYTTLGFVATMALMMIALLILIERRPVLHAVGYSVGIVLLTFVSFSYLLKTALPAFQLGF